MYYGRRLIMSKGSGMGQKRSGDKLNKGCDASSHSKQCGKAKKVSKGSKSWVSEDVEINPFHSDIFIHQPDD